jgi:site-specific DNA-methyltransferase (adenine-specific)
MQTKHLIYNKDARQIKDFVKPESVHLIVTSPPYADIKDYGHKDQIGFGQTYQEYILSLNEVWKQCFKSLIPSGRLCINVGDQFIKTTKEKDYHVIPIHASIMTEVCYLGYDYLGQIIWKKETNINNSGGGSVMGSYPYPPNGIVKINYEYIMLFKKPGKRVPIAPEIKEASAMTKEEWNLWLNGHWNVIGARQKAETAPYPMEIPTRLIRLFSFKNDVILDPFLGSGTTTLASIQNDRNSIGFELNKAVAEEALKRVDQPDIMSDFLVELL